MPRERPAWCLRVVPLLSSLLFGLPPACSLAHIAGTPEAEGYGPHELLRRHRSTLVLTVVARPSLLLCALIASKPVTVVVQVQGNKKTAGIPVVIPELAWLRAGRLRGTEPRVSSSLPAAGSAGDLGSIGSRGKSPSGSYPFATRHHRATPSRLLLPTSDVCRTPYDTVHRRRSSVELERRHRTPAGVDHRG